VFRNLVSAFAFCILTPAVVQAQDFTLSTASVLAENGFLKFIMPRFSLKTRVRPELRTDVTNADAFWDTKGGTPVMQGLGQVFYLRIPDVDTSAGQKARRFADWLFSDVGRRTIERFTLNGAVVFSDVQANVVVQSTVEFDGNAARGETLAFENCARCHVIGTRNKMKGIGSTPSFGLMRGMPDWQDRFTTFYVRPPHPAITQIEGITEPFDPARPPTIQPLLLTQTDVEDILTFVATVDPIDLGAPLIEHQ
jgi:mono/diheme cytochrome c family protein